MNMYKKLIISATVMLLVVIICIVVLCHMLSKVSDGQNNNSATTPEADSQVLEQDVSYDDLSEDVGELSSEVATESSTVVQEEVSVEESSEAVLPPTNGLYLNVPEGTVLRSPNVLVYNLTKQETIYSRITYENCAPASMIKMLTALVALDYLDIGDTVVVGDEIDLVGPNSSVAYIMKGFNYKMTTMLDALMLPSGNDAAYCLAVNAARAHADDPNLPVEDAVNDFVRLMNEKAKSLGCISSNFMTPDGYDAEGQTTTTEDMLKICIAAYNNPNIKETVGKSVNERKGWFNSNMLLREDSDYYNPCVNGLKTGSTDAAGMCLAVSAEIGSDAYIMLFMKAEASADRFVDANTIIELINNQYQ